MEYLNKPETWLPNGMAHNAVIDEMCGKGWCAQGWNLGHMPRIYHICSKLHPKVIVETGVGSEGHGSSTFTFLEICREMGASLISIDSSEQNVWFQKRFPNLDYSKWTFIQKNSLEALKELTVKIDFLHLDSGHGGYPAQEIEAAEPHLAPVHVIASHDTEQPETRNSLTNYAQKHGYAVKEYGDWRGQVFITNKPDLFEGLV